MSKHIENLRIEPDYVSEVCTGIKVVIESGFENGISYEYAERIFDTILPEADEEYEDQKEQIEGVVNRVVTCVNAMEGLSNEQVINLRKDADLEIEKRSVAFAEWFKENIEYSVFGFFCESTGDLLAKTMTDLYKYFIQNVYQK